MSSLPKARKDISTHPAKGSVTVPVDKQAKDADVDRKIRLYGTIDALRHHKLPSNAQIDAALRYILDASPPSLDALSPEGRHLIQDVKDVVATLRLSILEKNADEMIQDLMWNLSSAGNPLKGDAGLGDAMDGGTEKMLAERDMAVKHLRTLVTLVVTNSEVRKLLGDFSTIGRDLLARGASKAAAAVAPPSADLEDVDKPAPDNEFATEGGRKVGSDETPMLEARAPGIGSAKMDPRSGGAQAFTDEHGGQGKSIGRVGGLGDAKDKMHGLKEGVKQGAMDKMGGLKDEGLQQAQQGKGQQAREEGDEGAIDAKKGGMKEKMRQFRDNVKDGVNDALPQQHKDATNERMERSKTFFSDEYFPKERRDQFVFRGKKVLLECQNHDDYQGAMRWLISFVDGYVQRGMEAAGTGKQNTMASGITNEPTLKLCMAELRTLLERFANGMSMDIITDAIDALVDDSRRDPALRRWFTEVSAYGKKVLLEPGYILEDQSNTQGNKLRETGRGFYDQKYKDHFNYLFESVGTWFSGMREDPINHQLGEDWSRLTRELLFDNEGSLKFKPELWNDIRKVILPTLIDQVGYIPIPRVEYTDEGLDLVIENLTLQGRNIFPNIVALETNNFVKFSPYDSIQDVAHHRITLSLQQIQADMRDVAFYYRKKTGLAKMKDSGLADVLLGGSGLSATIELVSATHDPSSVFKVHRVHVKVDSLKFAIRGSNHDVLYKTLKPLATGLIKRQIQNAVGDGLRTFFEYMDGTLVSVRDRMGKAKEAGDSGEVLKEIFNRKKQEPVAGTSIKSKSSDGKTGKGSQFKIVADRRNSILAGAGHPSGWVNRTAEVQNIARGETGSQTHPVGFNLAATGIAVGGSVLSSSAGVGTGGQGATMSGGGHQLAMGENQQWKSEAFTMQDDGKSRTREHRQGPHAEAAHTQAQKHVHENAHGHGKEKTGSKGLVEKSEPHQRTAASRN